MMHRRVRFIAVTVALSALASAAAFAQQGTTPSGTHLPQSQTKPAPKTKPIIAAAPPKPATATLQQDPAAAWEQAQANARDRSSMMTCRGPLTLEINAKDTRDAAKGVTYLLSFKETSAANNVRPGECWRGAGFTFGSGAYEGSLNRGMKKGDIFYEPPVVKCPAIKSMKIENGKITGTFNEVMYSETMLQAATNPGTYVFDTKWLNFNGPSGQANGWGHYIAIPGDAVTPAVPGCR
jgi:hypothetical protein